MGDRDTLSSFSQSQQSLMLPDMEPQEGQEFEFVHAHASFIRNVYQKILTERDSTRQRLLELQEAANALDTGDQDPLDLNLDDSILEREGFHSSSLHQIGDLSDRLNTSNPNNSSSSKNNNNNHSYHFYQPSSSSNNPSDTASYLTSTTSHDERSLLPRGGNASSNSPMMERSPQLRVPERHGDPDTSDSPSFGRNMPSANKVATRPPSSDNSRPTSSQVPNPLLSSSQPLSSSRENIRSDLDDLIGEMERGLAEQNSPGLGSPSVPLRKLSGSVSPTKLERPRLDISHVNRAVPLPHTPDLQNSPLGSPLLSGNSSQRQNRLSAPNPDLQLSPQNSPLRSNMPTSMGSGSGSGSNTPTSPAPDRFLFTESHQQDGRTSKRASSNLVTPTFSRPESHTPESSDYILKPGTPGLLAPKESYPVFSSTDFKEHLSQTQLSTHASSERLSPGAHEMVALGSSDMWTKLSLRHSSSKLNIYDPSGPDLSPPKKKTNKSPSKHMDLSALSLSPQTVPGTQLPVSDVIQFFRTHEKDATTKALEIMTRLSPNHENRIAMNDSKVMPALFDFLTRYATASASLNWENELLNSVLELLLNMIMEPVCLDSLLELDPADVFAYLLNKADSSSDTLEIVAEVVSSVGSLNPGFKSSCAQLHVTRRLFSLLQTSDLAPSFVEALTTMVEDSDAHIRQLAECRPVPFLCEALTRSSITEVTASLLTLLGVVVKGDDPCAKTFASGNGIPLLMTFCRASDGHVQATALQTLSQLTSTIHVAPQLVASGAMDLMIDLCRESPIDEVVEVCGAGLWGFCYKNPSMQDLLLAGNGIKALVAACSRCSEKALPRICGALGVICDHEVCRKEILAQGAHLVIIERCRGIEKTQVLLAVCQSLRAIVHDQYDAISAAFFVSLLSSKSTRLIGLASVVIWDLCYFDVSNAFKMVGHGAIPLLEHVCETCKNPDTVQMAVSALDSITFSPESAVEMVFLGTHRHLVSLCRKYFRSKQILEPAVHALWNLSLLEELSVQIVQSGALEIFVEILRSHETDDPVDNILMSSIGGLIALCQNESTLNVLYKIGGAAPLVDLCDIANLEVLEDVLYLVFLLADRIQQQKDKAIMRAKGRIRTLSQALKTSHNDNKALRELTSRILTKLSVQTTI